jgi:lysophospholipase L1-like esterase
VPHVVLLGDSIFDNARYVPGRPAVIEQVRAGLPAGWCATLVAVDGHTVEDIVRQIPRVPPGATHLVVSIGGNDALGASGLLKERAGTVADALRVVAEAAGEFRDAYAAMLRDVLALGKPAAVCTVYDAIPILGDAERAALATFNDVISRAAASASIPLIDLRVICNEAADFSPLSPIEPSAGGGAKIAEAICRMLATHDFGKPGCAVYV